MLFLRSLFFVVLLPGSATLAAQFGDSYTRYRRAVRRWLPGRPYSGG